MDLFKQLVYSSNISREYEISNPKNQIGYWKLHDGIRKNNKIKVTVFMYEKNATESISNFVNNQQNNKESEKISQVLKKEATQLARLRHPSILHIVEPLEEYRLLLNFCTEPVELCLSNLLLHNLPLGTNYELDVLEIQKGLLQLSKGLQFCHESANLIHGNLIPSAIYITTKGDWKLGGFGFSTTKEYNNQQLNEPHYFEHDTQLAKEIQESLDYMAPEYILHNTKDYSNDIFALGCLIYAIFNDGRSLLKTRNNVLAYKNQMDKLATISLDQVPGYFRDTVYKLINRNPNQRLNLSQFQESPSFNNVLIKSIRYLDTLMQQPVDNKAKFMQGLNKILNQFPEKVLLKKILPTLLEEIKDPNLIPFIYPNLIYIMEKINSIEFNELIYPNLIFIYKIKSPQQSIIYLLNNLQPIMKKCNDTQVQQDILPILSTSLESQDIILQELGLKKLAEIINKVDYMTIKNSIFLRIQKLYVSTSALNIKIEVLKSIKQMLNVFDKDLLIDKILPLLKNTKSKIPEVKIAMYELYYSIADKSLDLEQIATLILPELWQLVINPQFSLQQFQYVMKGIKILSSKLEREFGNKLKPISNVNGFLN
ncbi:kinase-like protein [Neoconidiobolus thromboides FSU 785]|nr:kinase-like protein [Neoconidiobolus thromboides FSU 785]